MSEPDQEHYRCPRCGDEMHLKFARTHEPICTWASRNEARDIETFLLEIFP
ncbi:hypothetical protein [Streptomyces venezuelae]|uniref:hypothetical protein n=1 Tax=Streptomyces venezuelae TaxID=54571 RepID=UPI0016815179|nr:hypothetical protein [Streptomyces venezuelae]